jgi:hypothetical protein
VRSGPREDGRQSDAYVITTSDGRGWNMIEPLTTPTLKLLINLGTFAMIHAVLNVIMMMNRI